PNRIPRSRDRASLGRAIRLRSAGLQISSRVVEVGSAVRIEIQAQARIAIGVIVSPEVIDAAPAAGISSVEATYAPLHDEPVVALRAQRIGNVGLRIGEVVVEQVVLDAPG